VRTQPDQRAADDWHIASAWVAGQRAALRRLEDVTATANRARYIRRRFDRDLEDPR